MSNIVDHMGMARIKARASEWLRAMNEGRRRAPKCAAIAGTTGRPCLQPRLTGSDKCRHHLRGKARDALDRVRLAAAVRKLKTTTNSIERRDAETTIRNIERRQLHRAWKLDPTLPGSTLALSADDEKRVRDWLREHHHIDLYNVEMAGGEGRYMTPHCVDRLRWAAVMALAQRMDAETARRRVVAALRDDGMFWSQRYGEPDL